MSKHELHVLILRDLESLRDEIVREMESADEAEQPGLRKALHLLGQRAAATDEQLVQDWVTRTLSRAGVDPAQDHVRAVKVLRETIPGLGLRAGNDLVKSVLP
ncbi:hypothetical protein [Streptomyces sp. TRM75563]|uniref:hypothetical protein n=1 Tax=Streptomyces sp. TRM75563 TaxID=2817418 RepID=UPI001F6031F3|nr:hypothetical protein [Streptomyces sp. TRM75563]MCI4041942.1 hypothetical protein [Streptomyces sp. TRM75563]